MTPFEMVTSILWASVKFYFWVGIVIGGYLLLMRTLIAIHERQKKVIDTETDSV